MFGITQDDLAAAGQGNVALQQKAENALKMIISLYS
jgi:hypothetical protein